MRSKILGATRLALLSVVLLLASASVSAVNDDDICFLQPVDQCQGNQFVELGNTDADTDGKPYLFEADIMNGNAGDAVLQYKGSGSTSFTDVYTSTYFGDFGSSNSVFWQESQTTTILEGNSDTLSINGNEHTFEATTIDSGSDTVDTTLDGSNLGTLSAGETFTVESQPVQVSEISIGQQVDQSQQIADGEWYNFTANGDHNVFLDSVTDSNTVAAEIDGSFDNYDEGYTESLGGGYTLELTSVVDLGGGDGEAEWTVYQDVEQAKYTIFSSVTAPEDYNEYRVKWVESGTPQAYSDSLFFSVDLGQNVPADQNVQINDEEINQPRTLTNVTPDSSINLSVFQGQEQDPVNVTLVTEAGTDVATISTGSDYGAFRSIYDDFSDTLLSSFRTGSNKTFVFPTLDSELLSQQGTEYKFYFEIKDKGEAGNPVRTTKIYTVETSGTATNQAPNITDLEAFTLESGSWKSFDNISFGESIDSVRATVSDPDNEYLEAQLYLQEEYDGGVYFDNASYDENVGDTYTWDVNGSIDVDDSGGWTANVYASDDANNNASESASWSYPFTEPKISVEAPEYVMHNQLFYPSYSVWCPQYECINENETISNYLDPKPVDPLINLRLVKE